MCKAGPEYQNWQNQRVTMLSGFNCLGRGIQWWTSWVAIMVRYTKQLRRKKAQNQRRENRGCDQRNRFFLRFPGTVHSSFWKISTGEQKVFVHLMITIQLQVMFKVSPADHQGQGDTRLTLTPSVIPNSNYVIIVSDWNCLKYFCLFFFFWYCNHQVHREFLITLYLQAS
jgi:hypothetical protein